MVGARAPHDVIAGRVEVKRLVTKFHLEATGNEYADGCPGFAGHPLLARLSGCVSSPFYLYIVRVAQAELLADEAPH